jgi:hypothetical protein
MTAVWFRTTETNSRGGRWAVEHTRWVDALAYYTECVGRLADEGARVTEMIDRPAGAIWRMTVAIGASSDTCSAVALERCQRGGDDD